MRNKTLGENVPTGQRYHSLMPLGLPQGIIAFTLAGGTDTTGVKPNGTHFVAEQRKLSGEDSQITWEFTGRLAPLRYKNTCSYRK